MAAVNRRADPAGHCCFHDVPQLWLNRCWCVGTYRARSGGFCCTVNLIRRAFATPSTSPIIPRRWTTGLLTEMDRERCARRCRAASVHALVRTRRGARRSAPTTDYVYRGISQTYGGAALQVGGTIKVRSDGSPVRGAPT